MMMKMNFKLLLLNKRNVINNKINILMKLSKKSNVKYHIKFRVGMNQ